MVAKTSGRTGHDVLHPAAGVTSPAATDGPRRSPPPIARRRRSLMQLRQSRGADVGARAAHARGDVVDQVLDTATVGVQPHPRPRNALLEQRLAGAVERGVGGGTRDHRPLGRHAVTLLVRLVLAVAHQVTGRLVGAGEPRPDHHVRRPGGQRQRYVTRMADPAVGPYVAAEFPCRSCTFEYGGELRAADTGHHPGGAHRAGPDADLDDVRAGAQQVPGALRRHDVARRQRHTQFQRCDRI